MFAIYNVQGRHFRDTLEQLHKLQPVSADKKVVLASDNALLNHTRTGQSVSHKARQTYREAINATKQDSIVHAQQLMSQPVDTVQLTLDIVSAWQLLHEKHHHQLPVLDNQQRIVGMLSERNLLQFMVVEDEQLRYVKGKTVLEVMSTDVITADPVSDIRRIAHVMLRYHLSALPIVDKNDALIGLVSRSDILHTVSHSTHLNLWT